MPFCWALFFIFVLIHYLNYPEIERNFFELLQKCAFPFIYCNGSTKYRKQFYKKNILFDIVLKEGKYKLIEEYWKQI